MKTLAALIAISLIPLSSFAMGQTSSVEQPAQVLDLVSIAAQASRDARTGCAEPFYGDCSCVPTCGRLCHEIPAFCGAW